MDLKVISKYVPPAGDTEAPGEHYTLKCAEPERHVSPDSYRYYSFYRTARGGEVAGDLGYGTGPYYRLDPDGDLHRIARAAVEKYDTNQRHSSF